MPADGAARASATLLQAGTSPTARSSARCRRMNACLPERAGASGRLEVDLCTAQG